MNLKNKTEQMFTSKKLSYVFIFFAAIIYVFGVQTFLNEAGTFSAGLGAFAQLLTYTVNGLQRYFGILYVAFNIPFLIYFWKKIKKSFLYKTIFFLIIQLGLSSLYMIPAVEGSLTNLFNFGIPNITADGHDVSAWSILLVAFVGSVLVAFGITISWKFGGSTGGTDYIGYYYSTKKQKSVGVVLFVISSSIMAFAIILNILLKPDVRAHWLATLVASVMYIAIMSITMNLLYPKYSKVRLEVHSTKATEIIKYLKKTNYVHAYNLTEETSGYRGDKKTVITSVVLLLEVKEIVRAMHEVDPNVWISETRVRRVFGAFTTINVD